MNDAVEIASCLDNLSVVTTCIKESLCNLPFTEKEISDILFCANEAVINAIRHGNKNEKEKIVRVEISRDGEKLEIKIIDQGKGFDPDSIQDPTEPEQIQNPGGRGIFFMRKMADETAFHFSEKGTTVTLTKYFNKESSE